MRLRFHLSMSIAVLVVFGGATTKPGLADPSPAASPSPPTQKTAVARALPARPNPKIAATRRSAVISNNRSCVEAPRQITNTAQTVRAVGPGETGSAAWYGGGYIGRRTTSGQVLDSITPTAAHRTLPLNSLVRVTNLGNGRSVVAKVNDRGPISPSLMIDMSPKAAEQLDMKAAGIARVMVEQVVAIPPDAK